MLRILFSVLICVIAVCVVYAYFKFKIAKPSRPSEIKTSVLNFNHTGFVTVETAVASKFTFDIFFELKMKKNGFIMMLGDPATTENPKQPFLSVWVTNGTVMIVSNNAEGYTKAVSKKAVLDGNWHTVHFARKDDKLILRVDSEPDVIVTTSATPADIIPLSTFYIGGRPFAEAATKNGIIGMEGCVRNLSLDGRRISTFELFGHVETKCS